MILLYHNLISYIDIVVYSQNYIVEVNKMQDQILRKFFLGFIQIHILHHAKKDPFYGAWMIEELKEHGYDMSPGTLYPLLHSMESKGLVEKEEKTVEGKVRKYYKITTLGNEVLEEARKKAYELFKEIRD
ncbi:transcriptional regulator PadR family [Clostridium aceticum]|uniref:Transcriptional regulator PadR family n=2 Tax=Clostridium aceticum TaxID=84022 RepID=A0A0G3WD57_9CLOT|nr:transcriptional regulator PadR family [Clostridium aceticum]